MEIVAGSLEWTSVDEENLAKFLETETGKRFLPKLLETVPSLAATGDTNTILIRSGEVRGYQKVAQDILQLAHPSAKVTVNNAHTDYPSPENDAAWDDGLKLTPEPQPE